MDLIKEIEKNKYELEYSENGARCYQYVRPFIKLNEGQKLVASYLHYICAVLNKRDFEAFERELNIKLNKDLVKFYKKYNGFVLFSGAFSIYGFGRIYEDGCYFVSRDPDICLPYHLLDHNNGRINEEKMRIGTVCEKALNYNNKTGVVTLENEGKIEKWKNLDACIEDVYNRLYVQYLPNGIAKNPTKLNNLIFNQPEKL